jgi:hypothetical protein
MQLAGLPNNNIDYDLHPFDIFSALPEGYFAQIPNWADWVAGAT